MFLKDNKNKEKQIEIYQEENHSKYYWIGLFVSLAIGLFAFFGNFVIKDKKARQNYNKGIVTTIIIVVIIVTVTLVMKKSR